MYVEKCLRILTLAILTGVCRSLLFGNSIHIPTVPSSAYSAKLSPDSIEDCMNESLCSDPLGFSAIQDLHQILDDDRDGQVDITESDDFLREELEYADGQERQKAFHLNKKPITVQELWESWKLSEVHNWTVQETADWLSNSVDLPQYVQVFTDNAVDGSVLPRLASNNQFLANTLGIKDQIHKRKISLKAMDVVLFGPSKNRNYIKDCFLIGLLVILAVGCYYYKVQHQRSRNKLWTVMQDLECLQKADSQLKELQQELVNAKQATEDIASQKSKLEKLLNFEGTGLREGESGEGSIEDSVEVQQLKERIIYLSEQLRETQTRLEDFQKSGPEEFKLWLQLTYEMEMRVYNSRKSIASSQLKAAQEGCEKLRKKRSAFMGSFRLAHESSFDMVDARIIQAKKAYSELTEDLRELTHRWTRIGDFVGCSISVNPGFVQLQRLLYGVHQEFTHTTDQNPNLEENYDTVSTVSTWHTDGNISPPRRLPPQATNGSSLRDLFTNQSANLTTSHSYGAALSAADINGGENLKDNNYSPEFDALDIANCTANKGGETAGKEIVISSSTSSLSESHTASHGIGIVSNGHVVHPKTRFIIGGCTTSPELEELPQLPPIKSLTSSNLERVIKTNAWQKKKSVSQDQSIIAPREISVAPSYHSEGSLDTQTESINTTDSVNTSGSSSSTVSSSKAVQRSVISTTPKEAVLDEETPSILLTEERKIKKKRRMPSLSWRKKKQN